MKTLLFTSRFLLFIMIFLDSAGMRANSKIDSLISEADKMPLDTVRLKLYNTIRNEYSKISDIDGIKKYSYLMIEDGKELGYHMAQSLAYRSLAMVYMNEAKYDSSRMYLQEEFDIDSVMGNDDRMNETLQLISNSYTYESNYEEAIKYLVRAITLAAESGNRRYEVAGLINYSDILFKIGQSDNAHNQMLRAYEICKEHDIVYFPETVLNLSSTYIKKKNYRRAEELILEGMDYVDNHELGQRRGVMVPGNLHHAYANLLIQEGKYKEALLSIQRAIGYFERLNASHMLNECKMILSRIYIGLQQEYRAKPVLEELASNEQIPLQLRQRASDHLVDILENGKNQEGLIKYLKLRQVLSDSLLSYKKQKEILRLEAEFETELATCKAENLKKMLDSEERQHSNTKTNLYTSVAFLILLIGLSILLFRSRRQIKTSNIKLEKSQKEIIQHLDQKEQQVISYSILKSKFDGFIGTIESGIGGLKPFVVPNAQDLILDLNQKIKTIREEQKNWKSFNDQSELMNIYFIENLKRAYPDLSPTELKHCALVRMNLSAREVSQLLDVAIKSVETARYRAKKKLVPSDSNQSLYEFLVQRSEDFKENHKEEE